jgi:GTP cyclohydrolase I
MPTTTLPTFMQPGELELLLDEVEGKMKGVLRQHGDRHRKRPQHRRHGAPCGQDVCQRGVPGPLCQGATITEFPNAEHLNELMIVGPITVRSACSHHFCPVIGKIWIGVMPNEHTNVIGLSKYARLAEWVMGRPQIQEEAVVQLADLISSRPSPTAWPSSWKPATTAWPGAASRTWTAR